MSIKEVSFPKALNIIRPSSPLIPRQDSSSSTASISTISTLSSFHNNTRVQPTIVNPSNFAYFQNNWASFKSSNPVANTVGVNPHRFLQRPRSNSNLSRSTFFSTLSGSSQGGSDDDDDDDEDDEEEEDEDDDLDSIDGLTDEEKEEEEEEEEEVTKVVARVKHGTIMNGKGEFVSKGTISDEHVSWLDEARANRKIADLEIEKASLLVLNKTLEAKLRQQTSEIAELQKRLQMNEGPLTPVSDKHVEELLLFDDDNTVVQAQEEEEIENDQVFQRIRSMLEGLILQAEVALLQKSKQSGKVLQDYDDLPINYQEKQHHVEETLHKLTIRSPPSPIPDHSPKRRTSSSSYRRVSDASSVSSRSSSSVKMTRNLSRQSSPPVMVTSPRTYSPPPESPQTLKRSSSPRYTSQLRKNQDTEKPKWHF